MKILIMILLPKPNVKEIMKTIKLLFCLIGLVIIEEQKRKAHGKFLATHTHSPRLRRI